MSKTTQDQDAANGGGAVAAIVLAAGLGKRMKSELPKVLHPVCGAAMVSHVLSELEGAGVTRIVAVTGHKGELVRAEVGARAACVDQPQQLGTGHAVMMAEPALTDFAGAAIVTCGDTPLIRAETYAGLIAAQRASGSAGIVLTAVLPDATGYGRIIRGAGGGVEKIVEQKDANEAERAVREINTGTYLFDAQKLFKALKRVGTSNAQGEYYLTDVMEILLRDGERVEAVIAENAAEMMGVNSRAHLAEAAAVMNARLVRQLMEDGVTVVDPAATWVDRGVKVGVNTVIEPGCVLRGKTTIGEGCVIGPHSEVRDAVIGDACVVRHSVVEETRVPRDTTIGPYLHVVN